MTDRINYLRKNLTDKDLKLLNKEEIIDKLSKGDFLIDSEEEIIIDKDLDKMIIEYNIFLEIKEKELEILESEKKIKELREDIELLKIENKFKDIIFHTYEINYIVEIWKCGKEVEFATEIKIEQIITDRELKEEEIKILRMIPYSIENEIVSELTEKDNMNTYSAEIKDISIKEGSISKRFLRKSKFLKSELIVAGADPYPDLTKSADRFNEYINKRKTEEEEEKLKREHEEIIKAKGREDYLKENLVGDKNRILSKKDFIRKRTKNGYCKDTRGKKLEEGSYEELRKEYEDLLIFKDKR